MESVCSVERAVFWFLVDESHCRCRPTKREKSSVITSRINHVLWQPKRIKREVIASNKIGKGSSCFLVVKLMELSYGVAQLLPYQIGTTMSFGNEYKSATMSKHRLGV